MSSFEDKAQFYRKSRNPCSGELTARDNAEYLIPFENRLKDISKAGTIKDITLRKNALSVTRHSHYELNMTKVGISTLKSMNGLDHMRTRRQKLDYELEQMNRLLDFQKQCLDGSHSPSKTS